MARQLRKMFTSPSKMSATAPCFPHLSNYMSEVFCLRARNQNLYGLNFGFCVFLYFNLIALCQECRLASSCLDTGG